MMATRKEKTAWDEKPRTFCNLWWQPRDSRNSVNAWVEPDTTHINTTGPLGTVHIGYRDAPELARRLRLWADLIEKSVVK